MLWLVCVTSWSDFLNTEILAKITPEIAQLWQHKQTVATSIFSSPFLDREASPYISSVTLLLNERRGFYFWAGTCTLSLCSPLHVTWYLHHLSYSPDINIIVSMCSVKFSTPCDLNKSICFTSNSSKMTFRQGQRYDSKKRSGCFWPQHRIGVKRSSLLECDTDKHTRQTWNKGRNMRPSVKSLFALLLSQCCILSDVLSDF